MVWPGRQASLHTCNLPDATHHKGGPDRWKWCNFDGQGFIPQVLPNLSICFIYYNKGVVAVSKCLQTCGVSLAIT